MTKNLREDETKWHGFTTFASAAAESQSFLRWREQKKPLK